MASMKNTLLKLLNKQLNSRNLNKKEISFILEIIDFYPNIVTAINFTPEKFHKFAEINYALAMEIMKIIGKMELAGDYLLIFLEKNFSLNILKYMYVLIQVFDLPSRYITNCFDLIIEWFENENNEEQELRKGKLASFFILNLLNHEHITVDIIPPIINVLFKEEYIIRSSAIKELQKILLSYKN